MPEEKKSVGSGQVVDWESLAGALKERGRTYQPVTPRLSVDFEGLSQALGYEADTREENRGFKTKVLVNFQPGSKTWYDHVYDAGKDVVEAGADALDWVGDRVGDVDAIMRGDFGEFLLRQQLNSEEDNIETQKRLAAAKFKRLKEQDFKQDPEKSTAREVQLGVSSGISQNIELVTGAPGSTTESKLDRMETLGMLEGIKDGTYSVEDWARYQDWVSQRDKDVPIIRDVAAGLTNSILLLGEVAATGGAGALLTTRGLSMGSRQFWKTWLLNANKQGLRGFKVLGPGAGIGAIHETVREAQDAVKNNEDFDGWDFMASLGQNGAIKGAQAYMEFMSEGLLSQLKLGSVPLKKWLGKTVTVLGKDGTKKSLRLTSTQLKSMIKNSKIPKNIEALKRGLASLQADRKLIAKELLKNTGRTLFSGAIIETATEQVTDAFNDIVEGGHGSAIWIAFGDDDQAREAYRNLVVEIAVGTVLGSTFQVGNIWTKKPLEDYEKQYGKAAARELEQLLGGEKLDPIKEKVEESLEKKADVDVSQEGETAKVILDQGTGKSNPLVETSADEVAKQEVDKRESYIIAGTLESVNSLPRANVLDFVFEHGKRETQMLLSALSQRDTKESIKDNKTKDKNHISYEVDSYLFKADQETSHAIMEGAIHGIDKYIATTGLDQKIAAIAGDNAQLKKDLNLAVALDFDETSYGYLFHRHQGNPEIKKIISQAQDLQNSNLEIEIPKTKFTKEGQSQSLNKIQAQAKKTYQLGVEENIGLAIAQVGTVLGNEVMEDVDGSQFQGFDENGNFKTKSDDADDFGWVTDEDFELQDAPTAASVVDKAQAMSGLLGIEFKGVTQFGDNLAVSFFDPMSGGEFQMESKSLAMKLAQTTVQSMRSNLKMVAVGERIDGKVWKGKPGQIHVQLLQDITDAGGFPSDITLDDGRVEDGFIDNRGNFHTRTETDAITGLGGESHTEGVADANLAGGFTFETTNIPDATFGMPTYDEVTAGFKGNTVKDMIEYLTSRGFQNPLTQEVVDNLLEQVGDVKIGIKPMEAEHPGATEKASGNIFINPNATLWNNHSVWDTTVHEMLHSYLGRYMNSDTVSAKEFNRQIRSIMQTVRSVINSKGKGTLFTQRYLGDKAELQQWISQNIKLIKKSFLSEEEFITAVLSDTQAIKFITDRVNVGGIHKPITGWRAIWRAIRQSLENLGIKKSATLQLQSILEDHNRKISDFNKGRDKEWSARIAKENLRIQKNVTSGYETTEYAEDSDQDELLDKMQDPDDISNENENKAENGNIENFIAIASELNGMPEGEYRKIMRGRYAGETGFDDFQTDMDLLDKAHRNIINKKIEHLYFNYKGGIHKTVAQFRKVFLKRAFLNVMMKEAKVGYVVMGVHQRDPNSGETDYRLELRKVEGVYRDGNGKKRNTFRRKTALEGYLPLLEEQLKMPKGSLKIAYIEGFETWKDDKVTNRSSLERLNSTFFNVDPKHAGPVTGYISEVLWSAPITRASKEGMLYLGSFAGANTVPILTFNSEYRVQIKAALQEFQKVYEKEAFQEFQEDFGTSDEKNPYGEPQQMSATSRALLEQIWFSNESQAAKDWNKIQKRGTKWMAQDTGIVIDEADIEQAFGDAAVNGIEFVEGDIAVNAMVVNSFDNNLITFKTPDGVTREIKLSEAFKNELNTSTIDGASFYIIGHFDKAYNLAHAVLKDGTIKNLYSSRAGQDPLFIKHAMHGVHKDSALGQMMIRNNVAVMTADEAMKEGPKVRVVGALELMSNPDFVAADPIIPLKMSQFSRISESEFKDPMGGSVKQLMGGTAFSELYNQFIKDIGGPKLSKIMTDFSNAMASETKQWFADNTTPAAMYTLLKDVVYNPKSPQEQSVSNIWIDVIEPKANETEATILRRYAGFFQHAHTAEVLRNRMQHKLSQMLGGKTAGNRAVLDPNIGYANWQKDIDPILGSWNLGNILINMPVPKKVAAAAHTTQSRKDAKHLIELQRREQRAHTQLQGEEKVLALADIESERKEISDIAPHSAINWANKDVTTWRDEVVWGTHKVDPVTHELIRQTNGIINFKTGRLNKGWTLITEDIAERHGIKPGDKVMAVVTPTDSPLGVIGVRVAGIVKSKESKAGGRKVSDNGKATFNSEWIQTLVGKDFDIDNISIIPYDPRFWTPDNFNALTDIASKLPSVYAKGVASETKKLFAEHGTVVKDAAGEEIPVTEDSVFQSETMRQTYSILMNGAVEGQRNKFSIMGDSFIALDSNYLHDPAPIINERILHTALSTMNMRAKDVVIPYITKTGKLITRVKPGGRWVEFKENFNVRNSKWLRLHVHHLNMTNAEVDFPNKTTRLAYNSNPKSAIYKRKMGAHFWGLNDSVAIQAMDKTQGKFTNTDNMYTTLKGFQNLLFAEAFNLARQRNPETFEKLDYYETLQQLRKAQHKLDVLARNDKQGLLSLVDQYINDGKTQLERKYFKNTKDYKAGLLVLKQRYAFLQSFVSKMEVDDVYAYPLFNMIRNVNAAEMLRDMPGNTYKDHLINQVLASTGALPYYPAVKSMWDDVTSHKPSQGANVFKIGKRIAYKPAQRILSLMRTSSKNPVEDVRAMLKNTAHFEKLRAKLSAASQQDLKDAIIDFKEVDARVGNAFTPFQRDGRQIHVDSDAISLSLMPRSADFFEGRLQEGNDKTKAYWHNQLRSVRAEANSILHAFDETFEQEDAKGVSEQLRITREAHAKTYPILWKDILNQNFLFLQDNVAPIALVFRGKRIGVKSDGAGKLVFLLNKKKYTHTEINKSTSEGADLLRRLLTEENGLWEGVENKSEGTFNRVQMSSLLKLPRNLNMDTRQRILEAYLAENLYGTRKFTTDDQVAFWLGLLAQTSDQGMLERKATGFIVNQSAYDPAKPFRYQSNHIALSLMAQFEPQLMNLWMQLYSHVNAQRSPQDQQKTNQVLQDGVDANVDMIYEDAHVESPEHTFKHFFMDYVNEHAKVAKDPSFRKFYKSMIGKDWQHGREQLKKLLQNTLTIKALSENGVFYKDLVKDVTQLSDAEFQKKYKDVDTTHIAIAVDKYEGSNIIETFLRQNIGEDPSNKLLKGTIIEMYYLFTAVRKREGARNKNLTFMRRIGSNIIGYDLVTELSEKLTRVFSPKDDVISFVWNEQGVTDQTGEDVRISRLTHAIRSFITMGESSITKNKSQAMHRALSTHQVTLTNQVKRYDTITQILSHNQFRRKWASEYASVASEKTHIEHTARTRLISNLVNQVTDKDDMLLEARRKQIFTLAEDLSSKQRVTVRPNAEGVTQYVVTLGQEHVYDNVSDLIDNHFSKLSPVQKLGLIGAIDIREMYDVQVPMILRQALEYLERTREELEGAQHLDSALRVDAMIRKYRAMLQAVEVFKGNYMPHQFPIARYKAMWMKGYLRHAVKDLERQIAFAQKYNTGNPLARLDLTKDRDEIRKLAHTGALQQWDIVSAGWNSGSIIPNFIPRKMPDATHYTKTDPNIHLNYNTKLIDGLTKDGLLADWLLYQGNARLAGERNNVIELTRNWYANQIGDKELKSKVMSWGDVKPGQQVHFTKETSILQPNNTLTSWGTAQHSGIVKKITKDEVHFVVDAAKVGWEARQDIARYNQTITGLLATGREQNKATQRERNVIQNLLNRGFLTKEDFKGVNLARLTSVKAAEAIVKASKRIAKDPSLMGRHKRKDLYASDPAGRPVHNAMMAYTGTGVVERLEATRDRLRNIQLMGAEYESIMPTSYYRLAQGAAGITSGAIGMMKKSTGLLFMGMGAAIKARVVNQVGAFINNLVDAPRYNKAQWKLGNDIWARMSHGDLDAMLPEDQHLYKTLTGLGLTGDNILAIALEAANIRPEDMIVKFSSKEGIRYLFNLYKDATKYETTRKKLDELEHKFNLATNEVTRMNIQVEVNALKLKWEGVTFDQLKDTKINLSDNDQRNLWAKINELAKSGVKPTMNVAQEQGITPQQVMKLAGSVAWKKFFTGNVGLGFQAKAEKLRIPAFFIGYNTAIDAGYTPEEAIQFGVNSVELRHAFYGTANKQFGANTKMGSITHQYAQYQYNSMAKAIKIMKDAIPQMLRVAHNRPEEVAKIKQIRTMMNHINKFADAKGNTIGPGGPMKEVLLLHGILNKVLLTGIMMNVGTRIFYGFTNMQDPMGQVAYGALDFLFDVMENGFDFDDEDDRDNAIWLLQDLMLPMGMLWKLGWQSIATVPTKGLDDTFLKGRVDDTPDFLWRVYNQLWDAANQLGAIESAPDKRSKEFLDVPWLVDDFTTGIKIMGWTSADNRAAQYQKRKLYWGVDLDVFPHPYVRVESRRTKSFAHGRKVDTDNKGFTGFGTNDTKSRLVWLADPFTYVPFLDRLFKGKNLWQTIFK